MSSTLSRVSAVIGLAMCAQLGFGQTMSLDELLYEAVSKSQLAVVKDLLRKGANPNSTYANDWPLLFRVLEKSEEKDGYAVLQVLIDAGAKVNAKQSEQGWTPLHSSVATMTGSAKVIELLIRHGANLESQMPGSGTPLHLAASWGRLDAVNLLLKNGANVDARTELHGPHNSGENRQSLESFGGEPGYDQVGQTPLMKAAANVHNQTNIVEALLGHGANIHASDSMGHTALHMAALSKNLAAVKLLISRGAKVDARSKGGLTPLHVAVRPHAMLGNGSPVAELLLISGADPNARTSPGLSVIQMHVQAQEAVVKHYRSLPKSLASSSEQYIARAKQQSAEMLLLLKKHGAREVDWRWMVIGVSLAIAICGFLVLLFLGKRRAARS